MIADNFDHEEVDLVFLDKKREVSRAARQVLTPTTPAKQGIDVTNIPKS